ncbi:MAG: hypothetical protein IJM99_05370 [Firmicutes bacterium]|nr:hypothetical protein [Bacillota bacterium]
MEKQNERNNNKKLIIIIILLLILLLGAVFMLLMDKPPVEEEEDRLAAEINKITEISYEERQAAIDKIVADSMININYQSGAVFNGKVSESFCVKNIENNHDSIKFTIYDENGELIYTSDAIPQGYELTSIELDKELPKGTHECKISIGYVSKGNVSGYYPLNIEVK